MAEYYTRDRLLQLEITGYSLSSAGVATIDGMPASQGALAVLEELNIDASAHLSRSLTPEIAEAADKIYVLAEGHRMIINTNFPSVSEKVSLLGKKSIPDPVGLSLEEYKDCFDIIIKGIEVRIISQFDKPDRRKE